jgi:hypothetical protein
MHTTFWSSILHWRTWSWFHPLAVVNDATLDNAMQLSVCTSVNILTNNFQRYLSGTWSSILNLSCNLSFSVNFENSLLVVCSPAQAWELVHDINVCCKWMIFSLEFKNEWSCHWVNRNGCLLEWDLIKESSALSMADLEAAFSIHLCSLAFER